VAYTHFGARLARPGRFDSCTLYQFFLRRLFNGPELLAYTQQMRVQLPNGAPGRISSKVEPAIDNREVLVRFQHPAPICVEHG
jgi:hypothetical protein